MACLSLNYTSIAGVIKMSLGIEGGLDQLLRSLALYNEYPSLKFLPFSYKDQIYKVHGWVSSLVSKDKNEAVQLGSHADDTEKLPFAHHTLLWSSSKAPGTPYEYERWPVCLLHCVWPCLFLPTQSNW